ncbi:hypothetical protein E2562_000114 [Oryza meyeriana var. granulata]|uniref:Uncharacterized protein n=1 Tax=Oryza meyeriana var. granulata TaxID=110450 RepID=A0A6G1DDK1_9ORYZ|nr:hypothetical protein E2562_000114 [Oryza meyeriana var. granulata]
MASATTAVKAVRRVLTSERGGTGCCGGGVRRAVWIDPQRRRRRRGWNAAAQEALGRKAYDGEEACAGEGCAGAGEEACAGAGAPGIDWCGGGVRRGRGSIVVEEACAGAGEGCAVEVSIVV